MGWSCSGWPVEDVALSEIVSVEVPEGVTMGGGVVIAALPPPQPARENGMQKMAAERTPQSVRRLLRAGGGNGRAFLLKKANSQKRRASKTGAGTGKRETGGVGGAKGGNWAVPLVVTVTLKGAGFPFVTATLEGSR